MEQERRKKRQLGATSEVQGERGPPYGSSGGIERKGLRKKNILGLANGWQLEREFRVSIEASMLERRNLQVAESRRGGES